MTVDVTRQTQVTTLQHPSTHITITGFVDETEVLIMEKNHVAFKRPLSSPSYQAYEDDFSLQVRYSPRPHIRTDLEEDPGALLE
jgi:hypothetical protein